MSKIIIDGNIGCGKTTIITKLQEDPDIVSRDIPVCEEPVYMWSDFLMSFNLDQKRGAFGLQMAVLKSHMDRKGYEKGVFERSPVSCHEVFAEALYEDGLLKEWEMSLLEEFYCSERYCWKPNVVIYLECPPEVCYERIRSRDKYYENELSLEYLQKIDTKYRTLEYERGTKVYKIDSTMPEDELYERVKDIVLKHI